MCLVILGAQVFEVRYDVLKGKVNTSEAQDGDDERSAGARSVNLEHLLLSDHQRNINQHTIRFPPLKIGVKGDESDNAVSLEINGEISIAEAYRDRLLDLKLWRFVRK